VVLLKGVEIARYEIPHGHELAIPSGDLPKPPDAKPAKDPAFGLTAWWIPTARADAARASGFTVVDPVNILGTHLSELIRRHAYELLSRQDTKAICDRVAQDHPKLVEDLVPKILSLGAVQRVFQNLLRERVSIRDAASVLEALSEAGSTTRNPVLLTEYARQSIRRAIVKPYLTDRGELPAYFLDPRIEQAIEGAIEHGEHTSALGMAPQMLRDVLARIARKAERPEAPMVIVSSSGCRHFLRQILEPSLPNAAVLSHNEIPPGVKVLSLGVIE
jgi:flagellar biosynthesis protein FlhA